MVSLMYKISERWNIVFMNHDYIDNSLNFLALIIYARTNIAAPT